MQGKKKEDWFLYVNNGGKINKNLIKSCLKINQSGGSILRNKPKIYIAGFDVFYPNAVERGEEMKKICSEYGFEGFFPLDIRIEGASEIFKELTQMIRECDIIVANLAPFRGAEPDSGTCFECGAGYALGKPLYGYIPSNSTIVQNVSRHYGPVAKNGDLWLDKDGMLIEDFNLPLNLMLSVPIKITVGDFRSCITKLKADITNTEHLTKPTTNE